MDSNINGIIISNRFCTPLTWDRIQTLTLPVNENGRFSAAAVHAGRKENKLNVFE